MRLNIRSKLILAISTLMVLVFVMAAILFINEKKAEMAHDIYSGALGFSKLTASTIAEDYDLYLAENGFVYFNREIRSILEKNDDISGIKIVSYIGEVLYDSFEDVDKKYNLLVPRLLNDEEFLLQVQSENISFKTVDDNVLFLKSYVNGDSDFVDAAEKKIAPLKAGTLIDYFVVPASERYAVVYYLDYHNLVEQVALMMRRIIYLAIFGVLLGMLLAFFMSSSITKPVSKLVEGVRKVAKGDLTARVEVETRDEIGFLGNAFNSMAEELDISLDAKLYKERVTHELKLAAEIQNQIIPGEDQIPKVDGLEIAADLIPAEEIGGDIYDFLPVANEKLLIYLGDVTGHGVPAGIVSSIASALFYGYSTTENIEEIMINVNQVLKIKTMPNMFVTLCLLEWDSVGKLLRYVNAGHEQLIHYSKSKKKASLAPTGGIALGMLDDLTPHVKVEAIDLQVGDYLIVYSDGIPESWKNEKENYGMERFLKIVEKAADVVKTASELKNTILEDVEQFAEGYKQMDDITLIVLKRVN